MILYQFNLRENQRDRETGAVKLLLVVSFTIPVLESPIIGCSDRQAGVVRVGHTARHSLVRQAGQRTVRRSEVRRYQLTRRE